MKKLALLLLGTLLVLAACGSQEASIEELDKVPRKVEENLDRNEWLQAIQTSDTKSYYLVFRSDRAVDAAIEVKNSKANVKLNETGNAGSSNGWHVFKVKRNGREDTVEYLINGQSVPISIVIID
ncbi:hypothetical protein [Bhargavaea cecembensis]|uniref:hypothetical protein n=1 Tax=Bhargavaea cecembensis TaxID=394098 RepID=UPI00058EAE2B|nr:hypothetical protein [Bhargavaea cecembensis]